MMQPNVQLVDERGRKYLTTDERERFIAAAAHAPKPADQTFVLTIAHTGARVSEVLALRALDVDLDGSAVRIRTLKRRVEHWREVPVRPELLRDLEMVHYLREASPRRVKEPLWKLSRATAHRKVVAVMRMAGIEGPQACPKGLRHGFGIAAVAAGVPLPTIAAVLGHADIATTAIYTTAVGVEARQFLAKMWG
jgi:integrase